MDSPQDISVWSPSDLSILVAGGIVGAYLVFFLVAGFIIFKIRRCVRTRQKRNRRAQAAQGTLDQRFGRIGNNKVHVYGAEAGPRTESAT